MRCRTCFLIILTLVSLNALSFSTHWSYMSSNNSKAENWADLDKRFISCKEGQEQSPIALQSIDLSNKSNSLNTYYQSSTFELIDNGHTVQFAIKDRQNKIMFKGRDYFLVQFHLHSHSEHSLDNKFYPLELHMLHKNDAGELLVIGVFLKEGVSNETLGQVFENISKKRFGELMTINPGNLLPNDRSFFHYMGSLTTPPCSEKVLWLVMKGPIEISKKDIVAFNAIYKNNFRQLKKRNDRKLIVVSPSNRFNARCN